jgi:Inner membrane protein CreD
MRRLVAIGLVWLGCAAAWALLGSSIVVRSGASDRALDAEVVALWGPPRVQRPPTATGTESHLVKEKVTVYDGKGRPVVNEVEKTTTSERSLELAGSDIAVKLALEHRRKGLLWFPTYEVAFRGVYRFVNDTAETRDTLFAFDLEAGSVVYDEFTVRDAAGHPIETAVGGGRAAWRAALRPGEVREYRVSYRSRGVATWHYGHPQAGLGGPAGRARDLHLVVEANTPAVDFPAGTLSPSSHVRTPEGWRGEWTFSSILTGASIGIELPRKLNPGPFAERLTFFAPVSLLFFFFAVSLLALARKRSLHPMHYFFLGAAFFAFHLLFAYLIDHLAIVPSFVVSALVSVILVVTYARLFVGWRFALREMGVAQLLYLVLFSASFFWKGFTGLAIAVGAILTLFAMMQVTGRLDWGAAFAAPRPPRPGPLDTQAKA